MNELLEEFIAKLIEKQETYDRVLTNAVGCFLNRIAKCDCLTDNRCPNCQQELKLISEIEDLI